jgi:glutaredoxin
MAKEFFKKNKVPYTEYNVAADLTKRAEMVDLTGQMGVPVIVIGDDVTVGFSKEKVAKDLGLK